MKGHVYHGKVRREELEKLRNLLGGTTFSFDLRSGDFSGNLRNEGTTFGNTWEIRWRKLKEDTFEVLLLSEETLEGALLEEVPGEWEVEEVKMRLIPLHAPQFSPSFTSYPNIEKSSGFCVCRVYSRKGITCFVSPRRLEP